MQICTYSIPCFFFFNWSVVVNLLIVCTQAARRGRCLLKYAKFAHVWPRIHRMELPVSGAVRYSNPSKTHSNGSMRLCKGSHDLPFQNSECLQVVFNDFTTWLCKCAQCLTSSCSSAIKLAKQCAAVLDDTDSIAKLGIAPLLSGTLLRVRYVFIICEASDALRYTACWKFRVCGEFMLYAGVSQRCSNRSKNHREKILHRCSHSGAYEELHQHNISATNQSNACERCDIFGGCKRTAGLACPWQCDRTLTVDRRLCGPWCLLCLLAWSRYT